MKKILILGAGTYQLPLIKKAKKMGLYTIVSSIKGQYPGFEVADKVYYHDTTDRKKILEISKEEKIDAIVTTGTDVAIGSIGYVCDNLSLNGITYERALKLTDKAEMKKTMLKHGIPTSDFVICKSLGDAINACASLTFPVVFKATDKSGSRGIYVAHNESEIAEAFNYAMSATNKEYIIVEKFVEGYEIGIDAFISSDEGESLIFPHDKVVYDNGAAKVPLGHIFPIDCSGELLQKINQVAMDTANAFGLKNCFINMDVMITEFGPSVIEIGARCGGTCIPELIFRYSGIDYYELIIRNALGEDIHASKIKNNPCLGMLIFSKQSGVFSGVLGYESLCDYNIELNLDYKKGDLIRKFQNGSDRVGSILLDIPKDCNPKSVINLVMSSVEVAVS